MVLYKKVEKDGDSVTFEKLKVQPSKQVIQLGAAYEHLYTTCSGITPEIASELLTLIYTACNGPAELFGKIEES